MPEEAERGGICAQMAEAGLETRDIRFQWRKPAETRYFVF